MKDNLIKRKAVTARAQYLPRQAVIKTMIAGLLALANVNAVFSAEIDKNLEFKGVLIEPPPCSINNDNTLTVDFGDKIGVRKIASGAYRERVELAVMCGPDNHSWQLQLSVSGSPADFDTDNATVVTASQADLGVKLFLNGKPFSLDKPVNVNGDELPVFEALLVQRPDIVPEEGTFLARATLRATYQ